MNSFIIIGWLIIIGNSFVTCHFIFASYARKRSKILISCIYVFGLGFELIDFFILNDRFPIMLGFLTLVFLSIFYVFYYKFIE